MSQTLYRKYRSQKFSELVGQEHVTRVLMNAITRDRIGHAYLFSGPRGTGKTSVARIFAKALNCLDRQNGDCCNRCEHCLAITNGSAVDVIEIDAASKNKVDDVRDLRDKVGYAPLKFQYKTYIIDEVHMITTQAFNALLKTLEEPPAKVVFILCTTEAHKLPLTILSRCTRFDFQRLPQLDLAQHLAWIAQQEGYTLEPAAAVELADLADGSARDAVSLLDQLTIYCDQNIDLAAVQVLFQLGDPTLPAQVVEMLASGDRASLLAIWERLMAQGADASRFLLRIASELRHRCLQNSGSTWRASLEAVWQGLNLLKYESFPALLVELTLLKAQLAVHESTGFLPSVVPVPASPAPPLAVSQPQPVALPLAEAALVGELGRTSQPTQRTQEPASHTSVADSQPQVEPAATEEVQTDLAGSADLPASSWDKFLDAVQRRRLTTYSLLLRDASGEYENCLLTISFDMSRDKRVKQPFSFARLPDNAQILRECAVEVFGDRARVELKLIGDISETTKVGLSDPAQSTRAKATGETSSTPIELLADVTPELQSDTPSGPVHPESMSHEAEEMHREISEENRAAQPADKRPTVNDVMDLFGATAIDEEEERQNKTK